MTTIITKNSSTATAVPLAADLVQGELAVNVTDKRLFTQNASDVVVELGTNPSSVTTASVTITGGTVNGTSVGATTPSTGAFTTLSASGNVTLGDASTDTLNVGNGGLIKDASGNLGLGVTPSASTLPTIQSTYGVFSGNTNINIINNAYYSGGWKYVGTGLAAQYQQDTGKHLWYTASSGTAGNAISFTQAMTLDAGANLTLGYGGAGGQNNTFYMNAGAGGGAAIMGQRNGSNAWFTGDVYAALGSGSGMINYVYGANPWIVYTNSSERARIDSSGNLLVGTTSASPTSGGMALNNAGFIRTSRGTTTTASQLEFNNPNGTVGSIQTTGSVTAYNVSSDYRLKENIVPLAGGLEKIAALKPSIYNYKADPTTQIEGFIAHELQAVVPHAVTGEKDAVDANGNPVYQGVDASFLIPHLVAAVQEQQTLIENLTTRLAALEGAKV